jgi:sarcinarray family protein
MRRRGILVGAELLIFFLLLVPSGSAGECPYGVVHAWFHAPGNGWENATAHPSLHQGEEFIIKVEVLVTSSLQVFFLKLHEFGTPVYEVLDGPSRMEQLLVVREGLIANQRFVYQWTVRVRQGTTWVDGLAPLEVFVQFNCNDDEVGQVDFDVLTAYIHRSTGADVNKTQTVASPDVDVSQYDVPSGFDAGGTILMLLVSVRWTQKRKRSKSRA